MQCQTQYNTWHKPTTRQPQHRQSYNIDLLPVRLNKNSTRPSPFTDGQGDRVDGQGDRVVVHTFWLGQRREMDHEHVVGAAFTPVRTLASHQGTRRSSRSTATTDSEEVSGLPYRTDALLNGSAVLKARTDNDEVSHVDRVAERYA